MTTIHDVCHLALADKWNYLQRLYARVMIPWAMKLSHQVITVSEFSKKEILKYTQGDLKKITVIPCGVDIGLFSPQGEKIYFPSPFLLFVAGRKWHKNLHGVLRALDILACQGKVWDLVIIGDKEVSDKKYLHFVGKVSEEELACYYRSASALIFPSIYEGFGLPLLEAMSSGIPVITSKEASMPEVCGEAALYVDPLDPYDIARGIQKLLQNSEVASNLVWLGKKQVSHFSWEEAANLHYEVMSKL